MDFTLIFYRDVVIIKLYRRDISLLSIKINIGTSRKSSLQFSVDELFKNVSLDIMQRILEEQKHSIAEPSYDILQTQNAIKGQFYVDNLFEIECDTREKTEQKKKQ